MKAAYILTKEEIEELKEIQSKISAYTYLSRDINITKAEKEIRDIFNRIENLCFQMEFILAEDE